MVQKFQRDLSETQAALYDEGQNRLRLQMEFDAKESEIEQLMSKLALQNSDTASVSSGADMDNEEILGTVCFFVFYLSFTTCWHFYSWMKERLAKEVK